MSIAPPSDMGSAVRSELERFDAYLRQQMKSNAALLDTVIRYILKQRGKRVRPTLVFLSAGLCGGISDRAYVGAAMVELLHTATLVHDDVVDEANERRGMASINAVWKNKIAVLVGDYLLSRGLMMAVTNTEYDYLRITSDAVRRMSEGELLQIQKRRQKTIDEATYFKIISDKTASLISTCCEIGAVSASHDASVQRALRDYGEFVGLAFQIRDDILDYTGRSSVLGKPVGHDIRDHKVTLPLILAAATNPAEGRRMIRLVKSRNVSSSEVHDVITFVERNHGIHAADAKARELANQAVECLAPFPESQYKKALTDFANFVVTRSK